MNVNLIAEGEVEVGLDLGSHDIDITPDAVATYSAAVADDHPWYTGHSPFGAPVAPALLLHSDVYNYPGWYLRNVFGNLHARQEWELFAPTFVGNRVTSRATVIDRYVKRKRDYVVNEVQTFGPDGRLLLRGRTHQSFLLDRPEGHAVDKQREKSPERRFDVGEGPYEERIDPLEKTVTLEMCRTFSGPAKNYHNDLESAQKLGFPDIVVQGMMPVCFLSEFMTRRFGEGWYIGGRMDVRLVNVLWGGDGAAVCHGVLREYTPAGSERRAHCEVWAEKPDGTKIIVGQASALVP